MTDSVNDGGPAFPHQFQDVMGHPEWRQSTGMTLRDYFAAQALSQAVEDYDRKTRGVMDTKLNVLPWATEATGTREQIIARQAYRYADAMLEARK